MTYRAVRDKNPKRLKEGVRKFALALELDAIERRKKGMGLPEDWRSRVLKGEAH